MLQKLRGCRHEGQARIRKLMHISLRFGHRAVLSRHKPARRHLPPRLRLPLHPEATALLHDCDFLLPISTMAAIGVAGEEGDVVDDIGHTGHMVD
jgi:hypothetical protein